MSNENGNNLLDKTFVLLMNYVTEKNYDLDLNISIENNNILIVGVKKDIYFEMGQLLLFFYILNISKLNREEIKYDKKKVCIKLDMDNIYKQFEKKTKSEEIIKYMISKSTYNKIILPSDIDIINDINESDFLRLKEGFRTTYQIFMNEKINLINYLEDYKIKSCYLELKRNLMVLNPNDLKIQLCFIELRIKGRFMRNGTVKRLVNYRGNHDKFIEISKEVSDLLIKNSVIGLNNDATELMWIRYDDKKIEPIGYRNIYLAIFFAYISKITSKDCYMHVVEQSLNPVLSEIKSVDYRNNIDSIEYYNVLKLLYLLNNYVDYEELNKFIEENNKLFSIVKLKDKIKCNLNTNDLILENIYNKSLDVIVSLVLEYK